MRETNEAGKEIAAGFDPVRDARRVDNQFDFSQEVDDESDDPDSDDDWEADVAFSNVVADVVVAEESDLNEELSRAARLAEKDVEFKGNDATWVAEQHGRLEVQPWWRPKHNRGDANKEFKKTKRGCFCVRPSETELGTYTYACSVSMGDGQMTHMLLLPSYAGKDSAAAGKTIYRFGSTSRLLFNSVTKLIAYYCGHCFVGRSRMNGIKLRGKVLHEEQAGGFTLTPASSPAPVAELEDSDSDSDDDWEMDEPIAADFVVDDNVDAKQFVEQNESKAGASYKGTDKKWVATQHMILGAQPWFRPEMTRTRANKALRGKKRGKFVIRPSGSELGTYACSISIGKSKNDVTHMLVLPSFADDASVEGGTRYRFGTKSKLMFNSIPKLVAYHISHPYGGTNHDLAGLQLKGKVIGLGKIIKGKRKSGNMKSSASALADDFGGFGEDAEDAEDAEML